MNRPEVTFKDLYEYIQGIGEGFHRLEDSDEITLQVYAGCRQMNFLIDGLSICDFLFTQNGDTVDTVKVCHCYKPGYCKFEEGKKYPIDTDIDGPYWEVGSRHPMRLKDVIRAILTGWRGTEPIDAETHSVKSQVGKTMVTMVNHVVEIDATASIIPNPALLAREFGDITDCSKQLNIAMNLCALNNVVYDAEINKLVQMWISSEDLGCTNMRDHEFHVLDEQGTKWEGQLRSSFLPCTFIRDKKEGDVIDISYPLILTAPDPNGDKGAVRMTNCILKMHVTLSQSRGRYNNFGTFEKVLKTVTARRIEFD